MNAALHNHLRLHSGDTLAKMWGDLERLRRLGVPHADLPTTRQEFQAGLNELLLKGLAGKSGEVWLWLPKVAAKPAERMLFR